VSIVSMNKHVFMRENITSQIISVCSLSEGWIKRNSQPNDILSI